MLASVHVPTFGHCPGYSDIGSGLGTEIWGEMRESKDSRYCYKSSLKLPDT